MTNHLQMGSPFHLSNSRSLRSSRFLSYNDILDTQLTKLYRLNKELVIHDDVLQSR